MNELDQEKREPQRQLDHLLTTVSEVKNEREELLASADKTREILAARVRFLERELSESKTHRDTSFGLLLRLRGAIADQQKYGQSPVLAIDATDQFLDKPSLPNATDRREAGHVGG